MRPFVPLLGLCIALFANFSFAQTNCISYASSIAHTAGGVSSPNNSLGSPNGSVTLLANTSDIIVWNMGSVLPIGTQICVKVKKPSSGSSSYNFKIWSGADGINVQTAASFTQLASYTNVNDEDFEDKCVTLTAASRYIKVTHEDSDDFHIDAVTATKTVNAGSDKNVCGSSTNLSATAITGGSWAARTSPANPAGGTIATPSSATTLISGLNAGTYGFVWTANGCSDTVLVIATAKPNAGADKTAVDIYSSVTMGATAVTGGKWTPAASNPNGLFVIKNDNSATTVIEAFSASGVYKFVWTASNGCSDTAQVTVGSCDCANNKVENPSFEENLSGTWIATPTYAAWQRGSFGAQCGSANAAQMDGTSETNLATFYQEELVNPGDQLTLKFKAGTHEATNKTAKFGMQFYNASGGEITSAANLQEVDHDLGEFGSMLGYTLTSTAPSDAKKVRIIGKVGIDWLKVDLVCLNIVGCSSAGPDGSMSACNNSTKVIKLDSLITGESSGGTWSRPTGTGGTFDPGPGTFKPTGATTSTFKYLIAASGNCPKDSSIITITMTPPPNAGTDDDTTACSNSTTPIDLFSIIDGEQSGGAWSKVSGSGASYTNGATTFVANNADGDYVFRYVKAGSSGCANDTSFATVIINGCCSGTITGMYFNNMKGGTDVAISNGVNYNLSQLPDSLNLEISFTGTVESAVFTITGNTPSSNTENTSPYNAPGTGVEWTPVPGTYTVNVKVYSADAAGGTKCDEESYTFTLTSCQSAGSDGQITVCENTAMITLSNLIGNESPGGTWERASGSGGTFTASTGKFTPTNNSTTSVFRYIVNNTAPCSKDTSLATVIVTNVPSPAIASGTQNTCINTVTQFCAVQETGIQYYEWNFGSGASPSTSKNKCENVKWTTPGTKTIKLYLITTGNCNSDTISYAVNVGSCCSGKITSLYFNKIDGGTDIPITSGGSYNLNSFNDLYNLEATATGTVGSVKFTVGITGQTGTPNTENAVPYNSTWDPAITGSYTVNVKVYSEADLGGTICHDTTVIFSVTNCTPGAGTDGSLTTCAANTSSIDLFSVINNEVAGGSWSWVSGTGASYNNGSSTFNPGGATSNYVFRYVKPGVSPCPNDTSIATITITPTCPTTTTCFVGTNNPTVTAKMITTIMGDKVKIWTQLSKTFVDNTYGATAIGWNNHNFKMLYQSDQMQLALYDNNNSKKLEFKMDYLSADASVSSGYKSLGVTGGDGAMLTGNSSSVVSVYTSLDKNFNDYGYVLTENSPATDEDFTPNPAYPNWIFDVWYEVVVDAAVFGSSGFGKADITGIHASPSKTDVESEPVDEGPCCTAQITGLSFKHLNGGANIPLINGGSYNLSSFNDLYDLEASTSGAVGSIKFTVGPTGQAGTPITDNTAPYNANWDPQSAGSYTLNIKAYAGSNSGGAICHDITIVFTLTDPNCDCPGNIVLNPSFENYDSSNKPHNWTPTEPDIVFQSDGFGAQCGFKAGQQDGTSNTTLATFYQDILMTGGSSLVLKFKAGTHDAGDVAKFGLIFFKGNTKLDSSFVEVDHILGSGGSMGDYTINAISPTGTTTVRVIGKTGKDWLKVDAVCLTSSSNPANLGDKVFVDANLNGQQDDGEAGIPGVIVKLLNSGLSEVVRDTTDANGIYGFGFLANGTYSVDFDTPAGYTQTTPNSGNDDTDSDAAGTNGFTGTYTLALGQTNNTVDAGYYQKAALGDKVFVDANANGQQDGGEAGIVGVIVKLLNSINVEIARDTTDVNGVYGFINLNPGTYRIDFDTPSGGYIQTGANGGADDKDSDAETNGITAPYALVSGQTNNTVDAGYYKVASLGDFVWYDWNRNGIQDKLENGTTNEMGAAGIKIYLYNASNVKLDSQITNTNGNFLFINLLPGTYYLKTNGLLTYSYSPFNIGDDTKDSDFNPTNSSSHSVTLAGNGQDLSVDLGLHRVPSKIVDPCTCKNNATNGRDGQFDERVDVTSTPGGIWRVIQQTGMYLSTSPPPPAAPLQVPLGTLLPETSLGIYQYTFVHVDSIGFTVRVTDGKDTLMITNICVYPEINFQFIDTTLCINDPPIQLQATPNIPGTVQFIITTAGNQTLMTNVIDPQVLGMGIHTLQIKFTPANPELCQNTIIVKINISITNCPAAIGNFVWYDQNANGQQDNGELGMPNCGVTLTRVVGSAFTATTTTNSLGKYLFSGLDPGTYRLTFATPSGYIRSPADNGADDKDSDAAGSVTGNYILSGGQVDSTVDAGFRLPPDLTPNITIVPTSVIGIVPMDVTVRISEVVRQPTDASPIIVYITRDSKFSFDWNLYKNSTMIGTTPVNNSMWTFDNSNPVYWIFTTNEIIPARNTKTFGFGAMFNPNNSKGNLALTAVILAGSGGEMNFSNNNDLESVDFFIQNN